MVMVSLDYSLFLGLRNLILSRLSFTTRDYVFIIPETVFFLFRSRYEYRKCFNGAFLKHLLLKMRLYVSNCSVWFYMKFHFSKTIFPWSFIFPKPTARQCLVITLYLWNHKIMLAFSCISSKPTILFFAVLLRFYSFNYTFLWIHYTG